jgi:hypothetical protein
MKNTANYSRIDWALSLPEGLVIAELGVFKGEFSKLLFETNPKELHLIDVFQGIWASGDKDGLNMQTADLYQEYLRLTQLYKDNPNVVFHRGYTLEMLSKFPDDYFDLIYIDAEHSYARFKQDLILSYKKVKIGGQVWGHDYNHEQYPGVVLALEEFCAEKDIEIEYLTNDILKSFGIVRK